MRKTSKIKIIMGTLMIISLSSLIACGRKAPLRIPPAPATALPQPAPVGVISPGFFPEATR